MHTTMLRNTLVAKLAQISSNYLCTSPTCFDSRRFSVFVNDQNENKTDEVALQRIVPRTAAEAKSLMDVPREVPHEKDQRTLKVAVVGAPNVGKSTLTNKLMGFRVCSVSEKVHTTTRNTTAVFRDDNLQMVLLDTPGLVSATERKRHRLSKNMEDDPKVALANADIAVVVVDASNRWTRLRLDRSLPELLREHARDCVLVLNKVDLVKRKHNLLEATDALTCGVVDGFRASRTPSRQGTVKPRLDVIMDRTAKNLGAVKPQLHTVLGTATDTALTHAEPESRNGYPYFKRVFMISALDGSGIADLKGYLTSAARAARWQCAPSLVTDQSPQEIGTLAVREKLLDNLPQEIPYQARVKVEMWDVDPGGTLRAVVSVTLPKDHQVRLLLGPGGKKIREIADQARAELADTFRCAVSLKLIARSSEPRKDR